MNYKIGQKLDKWTFLVKQEYLVTWSQVLNDPNPIHLDNKKVEELGLGNKCINQGPANIAYILNCISYLTMCSFPFQSQISSFYQILSILYANMA